MYGRGADDPPIRRQPDHCQIEGSRMTKDVEGASEARILGLLKEGPGTESDLRFSTGIKKDRLTAILAELTSTGQIRLTGRRVRGSREFELVPKIIRKPFRTGSSPRPVKSPTSLSP